MGIANQISISCSASVPYFTNVQVRHVNKAFVYIMDFTVSLILVTVYVVL